MHLLYLLEIEHLCNLSINLSQDKDALFVTMATHYYFKTHKSSVMKYTEYLRISGNLEYTQESCFLILSIKY